MCTIKEKCEEIQLLVVSGYSGLSVTLTGQPDLGLGPETRDRRVVMEAFFGKEVQSRKNHKALEYLLKRYKEKVILRQA